jgi:hypothetical protein
MLVYAQEEKHLFWMGRMEKDGFRTDMGHPFESVKTVQ